MPSRVRVSFSGTRAGYERLLKANKRDLNKALGIEVLEISELKPEGTDERDTRKENQDGTGPGDRAISGDPEEGEGGASL
jgi:hypothetical protein